MIVVKLGNFAIGATLTSSTYPLGTMGTQLGRTLFGAEDRVLGFSGGGEGTDASLRDSPVCFILQILFLRHSVVRPHMVRLDVMPSLLTYLAFF